MAKFRLSRPRQGERHRVHRWIDTKALEPRYGVEVYCAGVWAHVYQDGSLLITENETEAQKWATEFSEAS